MTVIGVGLWRHPVSFVCLASEHQPRLTWQCPHGFLHGTSSDTPPARILIVDDDTELRRMVADYLEEQNMRVHWRGNHSLLPQPRRDNLHSSDT